MNNKLTIAAVSVALVPHMFPKAAPFLQKAIDKAPNDLSLESVKQDLLSGNSMMVTISDGEDIVAVNTLTVSTYPTGHKVLYIPITGGERMDEWLDRFMELVHAVARDYECDEIRGMACRKGWLRALKDHDWYDIHMIIGCKVKPAKEI